MKNRGISWVKENNFFVLAISVYLIGSTISTFRKNDAKKLKAGYPIAALSFERNDKKITTNKTLLYIGQTQTHLFLYSRKDSSVTVYKTSEIDSLNFKLK